MKKTSTTIKQNEIYEVSVVLNNTALVKGRDGTSCLLNIKTNQMVSEYGFFHTYYYSNLNVFIRRKLVNYEIQEDVTIYDADLEKSIFTNFIEIAKFLNDTLFILQNPKNSKYHILNLKTIKKASNQNLCNLEFDLVKPLYENYEDELILLVEIDGKKGQYRNDYKNDDETLDPIVYDDIKCINSEKRVCIFEKEGESHFNYRNNQGKVAKSTLYNKIEYDKNNNLLYCMGDNETDIYALNPYGIKLLGKLPSLERIECIEHRNTHLTKFIVKKDEEYSVYGLKVSNTDDSVSLIKYTEKTYEKIMYKDGGCYLYKGDKVGFLYGSELMDARHDDIKVNCNSVVTINNGVCDIYSKTNLTEPVVSNCELIEICDYEVVFRKNGEYGIYTSDRDDNSLLNGYNNITNVGILEGQYNIYIVEKNGLKGVVYRGKEIIKPEYKSITCNPYERDDVKFFSLVKNEKTQLAKVSRYGTIIYDSLFDGIDFYKDFYVLNAPSELRLCTYDTKLLKILETGANITQINEEDEHNSRTIYDIDKVRYIFKDRSLLPIFIKECEYYITTFEMDEYIIEASSNIKEEHDAFCNLIDLEASSLEELKEVEARLTSLKTNYPSLTLKMTPKHNN